VEESSVLQAFTDLVTLVYHEGRNARHLIHAGLIKDPQPYNRLTYLPRNREKAWKLLQKLRNAAKMRPDAAKVADAYSRHFGLTLEEMSHLFHHEGWRHSKVGGNRWAAITDSVIPLRDTLVDGRTEEAEKVADRTLSMNHNRGVVVDKLRNLDHALNREGLI
jgi:hypothetical protein